MTEQPRGLVARAQVAWDDPASRALAGRRIGRVVTTVADQGIVSLGGFLIQVLLARLVAPAEYGVFVLAYSAIILVYEVQVAVLLEPMMVHGSSARAGDRDRYLSGATTLQIGFTLVAMSLAWAPALAWHLWRGPSPGLSIMMFMPFGLLGLQGREFVRRTFYTRLDSAGALKNDVFYTMLLVGLLGLALGLDRFDPQHVFAVIGFSGLLSAATGLVRQRIRPTLEWEVLQKVGRLSMRYGRWMISAAGARWSTGEFYYYVVALFTGLAGAGALRAIQNLFAPISLFLTGIGNLILPAAARLVERADARRLGILLLGVSVALGVGTLTYTLILAASAAAVIDWLYAGNYVGYVALVPLVGLGHVLVGFLQGTTNGLRALNLPRAVFNMSVLSAIVSTVLVFPMTAVWGVYGAAATSIVSLAVAFPFWIRACVRAVRGLDA